MMKTVHCTVYKQYNNYDYDYRGGRDVYLYKTITGWYVSHTKGKEDGYLRNSGKTHTLPTTGWEYNTRMGWVLDPALVSTHGPIKKGSWEEEKIRKESMSQEERRKVRMFLFVLSHFWIHIQEYFCGTAFIQLSEVKTWAQEKMSLPENDNENIRASLLNNFELKSDICLSDKVRYISQMIIN